MGGNAHYVTDTHSLLWYLYDIPRLGPSARVAFDTVGAGNTTLFITRDEAIRRSGIVACIW